ncbi:glycosyltransferase family 2 protein [Methylomonas sp. MO1]|uniref:glycosyltransferase family 2 protein n=1 Tax=unclassified Methylomonas TaxID=2608980 RepID=UPI000479479D|nr:MULTISPECIES: glycosyltransferase family 2 protein [unclassified Methylomonas]MDT4291157.1 glycosyltransferase family 2 protein [Methylomonas sp. MO1]
MKISIVTVSYNAAEFIRDNLLSVSRQDFNIIEHIVVDGCSTDGTVDIVRKYGQHLAKFISEPDHGIYDAMNKGIFLASGDVIGTLNADDVYADDTILSQVADIFSDPTVDVCYADLLYVDRYDASKIVRYWTSCNYRSGLFEKGWMPAHPTFFVRRRIYEQLGGFDLQFSRQADFELTMRFLAVNKVKAVYIPKIWIKMRTGGISNNSLIGIIKGNIEAYYACRKNNLSVRMPMFILRKVLSRMPQFFNRPTVPAK